MDIFPSINIPVVSVIWTYNGLVPSEMETRIVSIFERSLTTLVNNVEHIESQSYNGVAVIKVFLQSTADINGAISEVIAESQVGLKQFPPGITPPLVISYDASSVPILQLGLSGSEMSEQQLNDLGTNFIRPQLATVPGAALPLPYGGKVRQVMVDIDSHQSMAKGLSPMDVVNAVNAQSVILPSGTAKIGRTEYNVADSGTPDIAYSDWWRVFKDPELARLEPEADAANQDIKLAVARVEQADAGTRYARSFLFPTISLGASASRTREAQNRPNTGVNGTTNGKPATYNDFQFPAFLSYEVDAWGRVRSSLNAAKATEQATAADLRFVRLAVEANVAMNYYSLREIDAERDVLDATVRDMQSAVDLTTNRFRGGLSSELEVSRPRHF